MGDIDWKNIDKKINIFFARGYCTHFFLKSKTSTYLTTLLLFCYAFVSFRPRQNAQIPFRLALQAAQMFQNQCQGHSFHLHLRHLPCQDVHFQCFNAGFGLLVFNLSLSWLNRKTCHNQNARLTFLGPRKRYAIMAHPVPP